MNYMFDKETKQVTRAYDSEVWAEWFNDFENRRISYDEVDHLIISTVFLGLDHNLGYNDRPVLFETMIFDKNQPVAFGYKDVYMERYSDYDIAFHKHEHIVKRLNEHFSTKGRLTRLKSAVGMIAKGFDE